MKNILFYCMFFCSATITAAYGSIQECQHYDYQLIDATNDIGQIGILGGWLYSSVGITTGGTRDGQQIYNLTLVPITNSDWQQATSGQQQIILSGPESCNCQVTGSGSFPTGVPITPLQLMTESPSAIVCDAPVIK